MASMRCWGWPAKSGDIMRTVDKLDKIGPEKVGEILIDDCGLTRNWRTRF